MNDPNHKGLTLVELINETEKLLLSMNYSKESLRHMRNCWSVIRNFAAEEPQHGLLMLIPARGSAPLHP